ncbi:MAG: hypothetical protein ACE5DR_03860 [Thermodesulfobacteriota bacterium]
MRPLPPRPENLSSDKGPHGPLFFEGFSRLRGDASLSVVASLARGRGLPLYLVGGVVRNIFLNDVLPNDLDFICGGETPGFAEEVARRLGGTAFMLDKKNGLYRVAVKEKQRTLTMDFLPLRFPRLADDLLQRDFTLNAMAIPLDSLYAADFSPSASLIDPLGGLLDCEKKVLRLVSAGALKEDPLRCLRAVRLQERYGLSMDRDTRALIKEQAHLIVEKPVSRERIRDELSLMFHAHGTAVAITELLELGLFGAAMPLLADLAGTDFSAHTGSALKTLNETDKIILEIEEGAFACRPLEMRSCLEAGTEVPSVTATLKLAAFFYDITAVSAEAPGNPEGSEDKCPHASVPTVLKGLLFGNKTVRMVKGLLGAMERFLRMPPEVCGRPAAAALFFDKLKEEAGTAAPLFPVLAEASARLGSVPYNGRHEAVMAMTEFYFDTYLSSPHPPFFTGEEIIAAFNLSEGERVGQVKLMLEEALLTGVVSDKKEAAAYIKKRILERWG